MDREAVAEAERRAGRERRGDLVVDCRKMLVGGKQHDEIGARGGFARRHNVDPRRPHRVRSRASRSQSNPNRYSTVAQVERLSAALIAKADDGNALFR